MFIEKFDMSKIETINAEPPEETITMEQYYAVAGLLKLAADFNDKLQDIEESLANLLPTVHEDTISEAVYENQTVLELLDRAQIAVDNG